MNRRIYGAFLAALPCLAFSLLTGCGGGSSPSSTPPPPAVTIAATSGSGQSATVGTAFANPLVATVTSGGSPKSGVTVTFTAPAAEPDGTFAGGVATDTETTNSSGMATTSKAFTAGTKVGGYTVSATATGVTTPASFSLSNSAGNPAKISATGGATQSATDSTAFPTALQATVVDSDNNPVSGVMVTFTAPSTGASGTFATSKNNTETDTTGTNGVATASAFTANATTGGPYTVTANFSGNTGAAADFSLTNTAPPTPVIAVSSGSGQSAAVSTAFSKPLAVTVTSNGSPASGVSVTFTAPSSGASGTFANGSTTETDTTNSTGVATSSTFTANATAGGPYTVAATTAGAASPANFSLTNTAGPQTYTLYVSGLEPANANNGNVISFYALAGAVRIDSNGDVLGGEQNYNDGDGITSPEPSGDSITGGTLVTDATTGQGQLTLITNNSKVGVAGTETLAVQFVNADHALIMEFDGSATSSGSMDLQTAATPTGSFAFTTAGTDPSYNQTAIGGVFTISGTSVTGTTDTNDNGAVATNQSLSGTITAPDSFGRGTLTISSGATVFDYYVVDSQVIRMIQVNTNSSAVGSAFSQGTGSFTSASLGTSVLDLQSSPWANGNGTLAQFSTSNLSSNPSSFTGVGDDHELGNGVSATAASFAGTYTIAANGVGTMTLTPATLGNVASLKIYMTDPNINLNDPNNSNGGGEALVLDLDKSLPSTTGIIVPQTDTSTSSAAGSYAMGAQDINNYTSPTCIECEFDLVAQGTIQGGVLTAAGDVSDPLNTLSVGTSGVYPGSTLSGTLAPDSSHPGRYTSTLTATINGKTGNFTVVVYQASGKQLYWLENDANGEWAGPLEQQGSLTGLP